MGTTNSNILPASTGLTLGNQTRKWIAHLEDIFAGTILSASPDTAQTGFFRLASTDTIGWRSSSNVSDLLLSKTQQAIGTMPTDVLAWSGNGIQGPFLSHGQNPASAGEIRLGATDVIQYRNTANTGDVPALAHNIDDTVTVGGGVVIGASGVVIGNLNVTNLTAGGQVTSPIVRFAPASPLLKQFSSSVSFRNATDTNYAGILCGSVVSSASLVAQSQSLNGRIEGYNTFVTVAGGVPSELAEVKLTGQTAAITTTTLFSVVNGYAGQFRLSWNAKITTAGSVSSTLGALTLVYTEPDGVAVTVTCPAAIAAGTIATTSTANTTGTVLHGLPKLLNCKDGTDITYAFAYTASSAASMAYSLHILLEAM